MKKLILLLLLIPVFIASCSNIKNNKEYSKLKGAWFLESKIIYKDGVAVDTIAYTGVLNDIYTENYYITLVNNIDLDSITGLDKDLGFAESGEYKIENGYLIKKIKHGTGFMEDAINKWKKPSEDFLEAKFKIDISENYFSKITYLDSLGNGSAELLKRIN
tara:strand:+ start:89 stop:571 length:483 start_codon:yes stop_codon:yes gene_type:complete